MPGFEFVEKLFRWPGSSFSNVLHALADTLSRIRSCGDVQQLLVCRCILHDGLRIYS